MSNSRCDAIADGQAAVPRSVARVLRALRAAPERSYRVRDLATIAGVSARMLQRQFRAGLDQTPIEALRAIRLDCARRELLRGGAGTKVSDVACRCGYPHLGRFSTEYRNRYGETPSQTLRRQSVLAEQGRKRHPVFAGGRERPTIAIIMIEQAGVERALAMGITEDLATAMLKAGIAVTDRRDRARYHLRAVFRGNGDRGRLTFRLLDAATGHHVWAYDHDGAIGNDLDGAERIAIAVVAAMQPSLRAAEIDRIRQKPDADLAAHELTMKAWPYVTALDAEGHQRAIELLERATILDPDHALALALMAWCYGQRAVYQFSHNVSDARSQATSLAAHAARLSCDGTTLSVLGHALACAHDLQAADSFTRRAILLDGGSAWAWGRSAWIEVYNGHAELALERFAISLQLAPYDPMTFNNFAGMGCAYLHLNRFGEAAHWLARAIAEHPPAAWAHRVLCPVFAFAGRKDEARRSLAVVQRLYQGLSAAQCAAAAPLPRSDQDRIAEGLETMGLRA